MTNDLRAPLKGIVIDPGHGGNDSGATSGNFQEKDFALEASLYMYDRFRDLGIPVALTRDSDITLSEPTRVNEILAHYGNPSDVLVISNHLNAGGSEGAEVIYALRNTDELAQLVLQEIGNEGQIMRKYYQLRDSEDPSQDAFAIMSDTENTTPLMIFYGFIDNPNDIQKIQENLIDYAEAVVRAVARYYGYSYVSPDGEKDNIYIVQSGDSLWSIARKFGTTVDAIKRLNNLTSNTLQVGQKLLLPTIEEELPEADYITHTVVAGDTLYKLAATYNSSVDAIMKANNLQSTVLSIGQVLRIPTSGEIETPPVEENVIYTVQKGDSLWAIAQRYGIRVDDIITANNLTSSNLSIGQKLIIPSTSTAPPTTTTYTVQKGDSLWSIAQKFGTTVSAIRNLNNLSSDTLSIGQQLKIPSSSTTPPTSIIYTVQKGDSLWSIAQKFGTTVSAIRSLNNLSSDILSIGQQLKIPK